MAMARCVQSSMPALYHISPAFVKSLPIYPRKTAELKKCIQQVEMAWLDRNTFYNNYIILQCLMQAGVPGLSWRMSSRRSLSPKRIARAYEHPIVCLLELLRTLLKSPPKGKDAAPAPAAKIPAAKPSAKRTGNSGPKSNKKAKK